MNFTFILFSNIHTVTSAERHTLTKVNTRITYTLQRIYALRTHTIAYQYTLKVTF